MNFKTRSFVLGGLKVLINFYLDHVPAQQSKENAKQDEVGKIDDSTIVCIVVVVLVVLAKLYFCACCFGDYNRCRRTNQDANDARRSEIVSTL